MTFELRPHSEKEPCRYLKKRASGRRDCKCKGPGAGMTLISRKHSKKANASGTVVEIEPGEVSQARSCRNDFGVYSEWEGMPLDGCKQGSEGTHGVSHVQLREMKPLTQADSL